MRRQYTFINLSFIALVIALCGVSTANAAPDKPAIANSESSPAEGMNNARIHTLLKRIDKNLQGEDGLWQIVVQEHVISVITDEKANRMRIVTPIVEADTVTKGQLYRIMQANFDSALDARYAIAKDILWGTFIHPLRSLDDESFLLGLGQTVNLAITYGTSYSSGALIFNGGDSGQIQRRELINEILKKGLEV